MVSPLVGFGAARCSSRLASCLALDSELTVLGSADLLDVMLTELDIAVHLFHKLPDGAVAYRPTPGQRSTLELLRYLSYVGIGGTRYAMEMSYDAFKEEASGSVDMTADEFPAAIERQKVRLRELFAGISDADLEERSTKIPPNDTVPLGRGLLMMPVRWLVGYKMQLFLYAKAAGNHEIGTANCWSGIDWKP